MIYHLYLSRGGEEIDLFTDKGIRLKEASGLGKLAAVNTGTMAGYDGAVLNTIVEQVRNITLLVRYCGAVHTHEASKKRLMALLDTKEQITLRYVSPNTDLFIGAYAGQVESTQNTRPMMTQIPLVCPDPYWKLSGSGEYIISGKENLFEFPLEIPEEGFEFSRMNDSIISGINNIGNVESGATWVFTAKTACRNPKIEDLGTGEFIRVLCDMTAGDVLEVCTEKGKKSIFFTHGGVRQNYFNHRDMQMKFFNIHRGQNYYKYTFDEGDDHACNIKCLFYAKFGGI